MTHMKHGHRDDDCCGGDCHCDPPAETVLEEAARIVDGDRNEAYGDPAGNHATTAAIWTAYLRRRGLIPPDAELDGYDVCWMNNGQKMSRDAHARKRDNLVDGCGFLRNAEIVAGE